MDKCMNFIQTHWQQHKLGQVLDCRFCFSSEQLVTLLAKVMLKIKGDLVVQFKCHCETGKEFFKITLTCMEGSSTGNAELVVIYLRKDLLRADKAVFRLAVSLVLSRALCVGAWIYRSAHTIFLCCVWRLDCQPERV